MPDNPCYAIRSLTKEEAGLATQFLQQHAGCNLGYSFCYHHASTIFICVGDSSEWQGLIVTYLAPDDRNVAVIETIAIATGLSATISDALLEHVLQYYKQRCVYTLRSDQEKPSDRFIALLERSSFKPLGGSSYIKRLLPEKICLHNRRMRPSMNTINGEVSEETLFEYFQKDDIVWGVYSGGTVVRGVLLGHMVRNNDILFQYVQINSNNEVSTGISRSSTEFLNDGRIILYEDWEWTGNRSGGGRSVIEEIKE